VAGEGGFMAFTFFFRDKYTLDLMQKHVIPELKQQQYIRIWDAGCAMGQEPYTLAMIFRDNIGGFLFRNLRIFATDIDSSNLFGEIIRQGVYPDEQLSNVPEASFHKYFSRHTQPNHSVVHPEIRSAVVFRKHDLLSFCPIQERPDLIICKNVLLHFSEEERVRVMEMFHAALRPGGYFIAEQTQKMPYLLEGWFEPVVLNGQLFRKIIRPVAGAKERGGRGQVAESVLRGG
jgi:chemotaxis protein methyltransferase CheR